MTRNKVPQNAKLGSMDPSMQTSIQEELDDEEY